MPGYNLQTNANNTVNSGEAKATSDLYQRISVLVQRFNAVQCYHVWVFPLDLGFLRVKLGFSVSVYFLAKSQCSTVVLTLL